MTMLSVSASFSVRPLPPVILTQPESETNYSGTEVTFSVVALGSAPLYFQWSRQGVGPIPGATNSTYSYVSQYDTDNGAGFSVFITNSAGSADSDFATNVVETNIVIEGPPFSITRSVGSHAAFRVAASGALPLGYQWSVSTNNGTSFSTLTNQTADTLWLTNVQLTASGNQYAVIVTNPFESYSNFATLTVQPRAVNELLTGYAAIVAADNPVAYWRLDELTNATTATDVVGSFRRHLQ
jgi:beta-galactosidase